MGKVITNCQQCGKSFETQQRHLDKGNGKYCSMACYQQSNKKGQTLTCEACGKVYEANIVDIKRGRRYCSNECRKTQVELECVNCGKPFKTFASQAKAGRKYCSPECNYEAKTLTHTVPCDTCGVQISVGNWANKNYTKHYCSIECRAKARAVPWQERFWNQVDVGPEDK